MLAKLPPGLLFVLSDILFFFIYYVFGYRRKIVDENLRFAFPEWSDNKRREVTRKFYIHLADLVFETIKIKGFSEEDLLKHCKPEKSSDFNNLINDKNDSIILSSHGGNWEWGGQVAGIMSNRPAQLIYKKLKNKTAEKIFFRLRSAFKTEPVSMENIYKRMLHKKGSRIITCFLSDQTPVLNPGIYWSLFLHRPAPFFTGAEKLGSKLKQSVYLCNLYKKRRGYYSLTTEKICDDASQLSGNILTKLYIANLEERIKAQPETWLWSHRRWKHSDKAPADLQA